MSYLELSRKIEAVDKSIDGFFSRQVMRTRMAKASLMLPLTVMGHSKEVTFITTHNGDKFIERAQVDQELLTWVAEKKLYMDVWRKSASGRFKVVLSYGPIKAPTERRWELVSTTRGNSIFLKNTQNLYITESDYAEEVLSKWAENVAESWLPYVMGKIKWGKDRTEAIKSMGGGHWQQLELLHACYHYMGESDGSACNHECKWNQVDSE